MINATTSFLYAAWNDQCLNSYIFMGQQWIMNGLQKYWIAYKAPLAGLQSPNGTEPPPAARGFVNGESEERKKDSSDQPAMLQ